MQASAPAARPVVVLEEALRIVLVQRAGHGEGENSTSEKISSSFTDRLRAEAIAITTAVRTAATAAPRDAFERSPADEREHDPRQESEVGACTHPCLQPGARGARVADGPWSII